MLFRTILALIAAALPALVAAQSPGDDKLLEMHQAQRKGDRQKMAQLLPQLRGHVLEPWAAYWELRARLDTARDQELQDFFTRYAGTYQEDRLRNDWLLLLGQRRDWAAFLLEYPRYRMNDDREVRCYAIAAQFQRDEAFATPAVADEVRRLWQALRERDDGCTFAAGRLMATRRTPGHLQPLDAWRKARLAMDANRPRVAADAVELVAPALSGQVADIAASPAKFVTGRAAAKTRNELAVLALVRMASNDPAAAANLMDARWAQALSDEEANWVWGVLGKQAAFKLSFSDALQYYARVTRDADLNDDLLAWKLRASLRAGATPRWPDVLRAVDAMSEDARKDPAWVYWKARALMAARTEPRHAEGREMLSALASVRGFYEMLALEELGQRVSLPARPAPLTPEEREAARLNPGLNRAVYAITLGLRPEGVREWNYSTNLAKPGGMAERELLAAAQFACEREVWDRCINTSERTRTAFDVEQRFPMPFRDAVVKRAKEIELDPAYVYGLIRQESRFIMDARSHVGASGLMQVMPRTARWTAQKIGMSGFVPEQLSDRDTNIAIGTGYLKLVLDDFAGSQALAAAAYNAGPSRPRNWRAPGGSGPVMEAAAWAESIPFNETRDYVKKVLANATLYASILGTQPQSLKQRLGTVGPRDAAQPEANKDLP